MRVQGDTGGKISNHTDFIIALEMLSQSFAQILQIQDKFGLYELVLLGHSIFIFLAGCSSSQMELSCRERERAQKSLQKEGIRSIRQGDDREKFYTILL